MYVTDDFILITFNNDTYHLYHIDLGMDPDYAIHYPSGWYDIPSPVRPFEDLILVDESTQEYLFIYSPNSVDNNNYLYYYSLDRIADSSGNPDDMSFSYVSALLLGDLQLWNMALSDDLMVLGCPECNDLRGRFEIRNNDGSVVLYTFVGNSDTEGGQHYWGVQVDILTYDMYSLVFVTSHDIALETSRQYYIDIVTCVP